MRVAVTGTPGTGKTTAVERADTPLSVVHLNEVIRERGFDRGTDDDRGSLVADLDAVESHLAHHVDADRVVVLRCHPDELERRLRERGEAESKARENAEAEMYDVVLSEAVETHGLDRVYEVDTTDREPSAVAGAIERVVAGEREPTAGEVDFLDV